jgi:UDP-N-acetyl-D-mannosaminuronic acid dehydrogenase
LSEYLTLLEKIGRKKGNFAVIGLGHVGLPTALVFARAGFNVAGIDNDPRKLEALNGGRCYIQEPELQELLGECLRDGTFNAASKPADSIRASNFVIICVPTPVDNGVPDLSSFKSAFDMVKASAHDGLLILLESTLPPGSISRLVVPELQDLGYRIDENVFLAYCPERLSPGSALRDFVENTRIVGGIGPNSNKLASELIKAVCKDVLITDALTAELAKVAENTFRDLNIAYANLLALIAENLGGDADEVIRLANTHPRVAIHKPGLGVGGPCLPKDPYLLIHGASENVGQLIKVSRRLNDQMPLHVFNLLSQVLKERQIAIDNAKVAVLGVAYKADTEDVTNSPAKPIIQKLLEAGATVCAYDPYSSEAFGAERTNSIDEVLRGADCVIIVTAHSGFKSVDPVLIEQLAKAHCVVFDGPRVLDRLKVEKLGLNYLATGYGGVKRPANLRLSSVTEPGQPE